MQSLVRDSVRLVYTEAGADDPPLLFIHGWCCDHSYFQPQFEYFQRHHRVVAIDLRGHGESDKPVQDYTIAGFAADTAWLLEQLDLRQVVAIGHSMGGVVALELAVRRPDLVAAVIGVDASLVVRPHVRTQMLDGPVAELHTPAYREVARALVEGALFLPTDDPALKARVVEEMTNVPQYVMASAAQDMFSRDSEATAAACHIPLLAIDAGSPRSDLTRLRELCPQAVIEHTTGVGHFNQLLAADQVNASIERFLAHP